LHHDFTSKNSGFFGATDELQALARLVQPGGGLANRIAETPMFPDDS
jgi:hypothetical protein